MHSQECNSSSWRIFVNFLVNMPTVTLGVFSAARVYGMLDRPYIISALVFLLSLTSMGMSLVSSAFILSNEEHSSAADALQYMATQGTAQYVNNPVLGASCYIDSIVTPSLLFNFFLGGVTLVGLLTTVGADVVAIVTTCIKTYHHVRQATTIGMRVSFSATLLQYGALYFVVLCAGDVANLLFFLLASFASDSPLGLFISIFPNIVISRFLINLRQVDSNGSESGVHPSQISAVRFRAPTHPDIIGNLGEPLADGNSVSDDEDYGDAEWCQECSRETLAVDEEEERSSAPYPDHHKTDEVRRTVWMFLTSAALSIDWHSTLV
ncbi:hypothetical protein NM688_g4640 [Phlebia brevispora]|uniref:Uncharacterized protein n=1 Tax=Phlebia brevispora TaxID=194682 RepID=A0ACC1T2D2_9APHY|nr:hypothetical protein NM688_g4640 [Phlebia brevispora]